MTDARVTSPSAPNEASERDLRFAFALMAVCLVGLVLRAIHLDIPLRYDETFTFSRYASEGWRVITTVYDTPNNHVFHTLLVSGVTGWLGADPVVIRLPAFAAGCLLIPATAWVAFHAGGRRAGIVAAAIVATSPVLIEYSTNARGYTIMVLAALLAVGIGQRLIQKSSWLLWFALIDVGVVGFYTLPTMAIPWLGIMLWLTVNLIADAETPDARARVLVTVLAANVAAGALTAALYWGIISNAGLEALTENRFVAASPLGTFLLEAPQALFGVTAHWTRGMPIPLVIVGLGVGVAGWLSSAKNPWRSLPVALVAGAAAILLVKRNPGEARVWLWIVPLLAVGVGLGAADLSTRVRRMSADVTVAGFAGAWALVMSALLMTASPVRASLETGAFPEGEQVAIQMMEHYRAGDVVMTDFITAEPLDYYVRKYRSPLTSATEGSPTIQRTWVVLNKREDHRARRVLDRITQMRAPPLTQSNPVFSVGEVDVFLFGRSAASADPRLLEAIDWYTGVAGRVDDVRAHQLLLEVLEETNSALARMWLARCHSRGRMGFDRDEDLARTLASEVIQEIRELAETDEPEAIFLMGTAFDEGLGVEANPATAFEWFTAAAEVGHVLAAHNIGNAYRVGRGVQADPEAAVYWWTVAAERGDAITQLRLGEAFEAGNGVERSVPQAIAWYAQAAERGNPDARAALSRLGG